PEAMSGAPSALADAGGPPPLHVFPFSPRPGTPAARMPQVRRETVKDRARRLRQKGEAALRRHLDREIGARRSVLVESRDLGRTEHFTPVRLTGAAEPGAAEPGAAEPGSVYVITISGHDGRHLLA